MCKQQDESLIGKCEHNITQGFLLGVIYYDIKRILLTNLQYYQKICIHGFPLFCSSNSACSFELLLATVL